MRIHLHPKAARQRGAFTLIELLVVMAIIAILIGLLLPAVQKVRETAARMRCQNNLKQMGIALHSYHDTNGTLPAGAQSTGNQWSWHVPVLPYLEQENLYKSADFTTAYNSNNNLQRLGLTKVPLYFCPSASSLDEVTVNANEYSPPTTGTPTYTTHYYGVAGPKGTNTWVTPNVTYSIDNTGVQGGFCLQGMLGKNSKVKFTEVRDGTSNTFMVAELSWNVSGGSPGYRVWTRGADVDATGGCKNVTNALNTVPFSSGNFNDISFGSNHVGGTNFLLGDGSVRIVRDAVGFAVYQAMSSYNGKEAVSLD